MEGVPRHWRCPADFPVQSVFQIRALMEAGESAVQTRRKPGAESAVQTRRKPGAEKQAVADDMHMPTYAKTYTKA